MTVQCCKCKRVREHGQWSASPVVMQGNASHTYCPTCMEECLEEMRELHRAQQSRTPRTQFAIQGQTL